MSDPIKALIDAAERAWDIYRVDPSPVFLVSDSMEGLSKAIAAAKAAAEARPKPKPVRHCAKCGKPENAHDVRHPFVGTGEPIRPEPKPDSAARDWPEDFAHENGNYSVLCSICQQWFLGYKRRVACKVCATKEARPDPAAEPSATDNLIDAALGSWSVGDTGTGLRQAIEAIAALAREVRR